MKYTLSHKLTASERSSLKAASADLSKALAGITSACEAAAADERKLKRMEAQQGALEKKAKAGSLAAETQLIAITNQVARTRDALSKSGRLAVGSVALNQAMDQCFTLAQQIIAPNLREQVQDLAEERNADFFFDRGQARAVASNCDALQALHQTFQSNPFGTERISEAERLLHIIRAALAGGTVWEFPPAKPGKR
jgi:hypothetical protein